MERGHNQRSERRRTHWRAHWMDRNILYMEGDSRSEHTWMWPRLLHAKTMAVDGCHRTKHGTWRIEADKVLRAKHSTSNGRSISYSSIDWHLLKVRQQWETTHNEIKWFNFQPGMMLSLGKKSWNVMELTVCRNEVSAPSHIASDFHIQFQPF